MGLTDSFTWEDRPTRDADTGQLTAAGWIPLTMKYSGNEAIAILFFHIVRSTIRIVTNHETVAVAWYPFDWTFSLLYELVSISQVTLGKTEFSSIYSYSIFNFTVEVNCNIRYIFFSFVLFFLSVLFPSLIFQDAVRLQRVGRFAEKKRVVKICNETLLV
jgi:hypothetical protein